MRSSSFILLRWTMNLSLVVFLSPHITHLIYGQTFAFQQGVRFETMRPCRILRLQNQSWKSVKFPRAAADGQVGGGTKLSIPFPRISDGPSCTYSPSLFCRSIVHRPIRGHEFLLNVEARMYKLTDFHAPVPQIRMTGGVGVDTDAKHIRDDALIVSGFSRLRKTYLVRSPYCVILSPTSRMLRMESVTGLCSLSCVAM